MKKIIAISFLFFLVLSSCAPVQNSPIDPVQEALFHEERAYLLDLYQEFVDLHENLVNSPNTGADVEKSYYECQNVITDVADVKYSDNNKDLATSLLTGLIKYCTGFACYSNKALCNSDSEAAGLMYQGKQLLDEFYENIQ
jgi:hypothetical protein